MRPGQQKQRSRGRGSSSNNSNNNNNNNGNNSRKGQNPLTRTYDSSGPDVKIRGTAQNIAEKYATLARDAQSSGDRVMAENYLQHAEHYNRIIAAAQAMYQERFYREERNEFSERDGSYSDRESNADNSGSDNDDNDSQDMEEPMQSHGREREPVMDGSGPQPVIEGTPAEVAIEEAAAPNQPRSERPNPASRRRPAGRPRRQPRDGDGGEVGAAYSAEPANEPTPEVTE